MSSPLIDRCFDSVVCKSGRCCAKKEPNPSQQSRPSVYEAEGSLDMIGSSFAQAAPRLVAALEDH